MKNKTTWIAVIIIIIIGALFLFKKDKVPAEPTGEPIRIGVATLLSGDFAALGENIVKSAEIAVEEVNKSGGINGRPIELVIEDAGLTGKTGVSAVQKLIQVDGVDFIIGGTSSNGTLAIAPIVNAEQVLYLIPVTGGSNIDDAGEYVFRIANADILAGRDIANAMSELGFDRVGVVAEVTDYTLDIKRSFEKTAKDNNQEIVITEEYQPGLTDFKTLVAKVKQSGPQALLIASQTGISGAHFMKQAKDAGLEIVYFSDFTLVTNSSVKDIVGSLEGVYFTDPKYDDQGRGMKKFLDIYREKFNSDPFIPFHSAATYDSIMIVSQAIMEVGDNPESVRDWMIENVKNWKGLMGTFSLDGNGNSDLGFGIKQVKNGEFVNVE